MKPSGTLFGLTLLVAGAVGCAQTNPSTGPLKLSHEAYCKATNLRYVPFVKKIGIVKTPQGEKLAVNVGVKSCQGNQKFDLIMYNQIPYAGSSSNGIGNVAKHQIHVDPINSEKELRVHVFEPRDVHPDGSMQHGFWTFKSDVFLTVKNGKFSYKLSKPTTNIGLEY